MSENFNYTPSHIANFFLEKKDCHIDSIKLNKIIYISFGYALALFNRELFKEKIEAWKYGPVIPSIYHEFKSYGLERIDKLSQFFSFTKDKMCTPAIEKEDGDLQELLTAIYDGYGHFSSLTLVKRTHQSNSPWHKNYKKGDFGKIIPNDDIKQYYSSLLSEKN